MINKIKGEEGFSLLEVIISIAALAILSIFILQMFLVSSKVNLKAKNMDYASNLCISVIEFFKSGKDPSEIFGEYDFTGAQMSIGQSEYVLIDSSEVVQEFMKSTDFTNEIKIYQFFDKHWKPIYIEDIFNEPLEASHKDIRFVMSFKILPFNHIQEENKSEEQEDKIEEELAIGMLCKISVKAYDLSYGETDKRELAEYEALNYFSDR